jgi:SHS2 domain-containing protein
MTTAPLEGVSALDHTADVGLELRAPDFPELLRRATRGLAWLLLERSPPASSEERELHLRAPNPGLLLRELLRELAWWHDAEGCVVADLEDVRVADTAEGHTLSARARVVRAAGEPVREIKGVTLHGLVAEPREGGWFGRVIFDV